MVLHNTDFTEDLGRPKKAKDFGAYVTQEIHYTVPNPLKKLWRCRLTGEKLPINTMAFLG